MNVQDVIAIAAVGVALVYVARRAWRVFGGRGGCHCGKSTQTGAKKSDRDMAPSIRPIVPLTLEGRDTTANDAFGE